VRWQPDAHGQIVCEDVEPLTDLPDDWQLTGISFGNAAGTLVGYATAPDWYGYAVLLTPIPPPRTPRR
jgi:hypothetical protein